MNKYRYSEAELEFIEESPVPFAVYQFINNRVVTIALSGGFMELSGYTRANKRELYELMDNNMYRDTHPDDLATLGDAAYKFATGGGAYDVIYRTKKDGEYRMIHAHGKHIYKENGVRLAFVWYMDKGPFVGDGKREKDGIMNAWKELLEERSFSYQVEHDRLTGLPDMSYFFDLAHAGCRDISRSGKVPVILFLDFNGMKVFNLKYGLEEGDRFLKAFADEIVELFSHENCSRFSADHFCVFTDEETARAGTAKLINSYSDIGAEKKMPLRIGMYVHDDPEISISGACDRAKMACDSGRNVFTSKVYLFEKEMMTSIEEKQYVIENIDRAIDEDWITVYYQPIVRTASGKVCFEECLARWIDPGRGFMSPAEFIPALEESGLIYKLDLCIVDKALEKLKVQADSGLFQVPQSVNLSRSDFYTCDIVEEIRSRVDRVGIPREMLVVEITESVVADDVDYMTKEINRFRELGFRVWMDDYGSGYSSPEILHKISFDLLKIDMMFVRQLEEDEKSRIILTEIVRMAMALGMDTIAEGVETQQQADFLMDIGCTMLQGYLFCKPVSLEQIMERYRNGTQIGFENPEESEYYSQLGKVNMYNLTHSSTDEVGNQDYFDTWPMVMVEIRNGMLTVIKANVTFKEYVITLFPNTFGKMVFDTSELLDQPGGASLRAVMQCAEDGKRVILNDTTESGKNIQILVWRVAVNPVTGAAGVMIVVLSATETRGASDGESERRLDQLTGEFRKLQRENARLQEEIDANNRIAALQKSLTDLLEYMPLVMFSKDVVTRKYLACNQAFADYAHKETPEGVVGLTDFEIFDTETAIHFIEDDKKALAMDEPYVFYEDVPDAVGNPRQFQTTKLRFTDETGRECLLGLCQDVTEAMRIKHEYVQKLTVAKNMAEIDALTGIKNKNAYKMREDLMNARIQDGKQPEFAIVVFDVNDLKRINDTEGHEVGDKRICEACEIICKTFKRSPVYRIGGDEFVVISQDEDYDRSEALLDTISLYNGNAIVDGKVVIACGMARFEDDDDVAAVFRRADRKMYENKLELKSRKK